MSFGVAYEIDQNLVVIEMVEEELPFPFQRLVRSLLYGAVVVHQNSGESVAVVGEHCLRDLWV